MGNSGERISHSRPAANAATAASRNTPLAAAFMARTSKGSGASTAG